MIDPLTLKPGDTVGIIYGIEGSNRMVTLVLKERVNGVNPGWRYTGGGWDLDTFLAEHIVKVNGRACGVPFRMTHG